MAMDEIAERFKRAFETGRFEARTQKKDDPQAEIMRGIIAVQAEALGLASAQAAYIEATQTMSGIEGIMRGAFNRLRSQISNSGEPDAEPPI